MKKVKNKIVVRVGAGVLAVAVVTGTVLGVRAARGGSNAVGVYELSGLSSDADNMGMSSEMSGTVSADEVQTVYVSDTQTVTKVFVEEGQQVRKGDVLLTYDTTLTDIELTRKELEIQKQKLELEKMQKQVKTRKRLDAAPPQDGVDTQSEEGSQIPSGGDNTGSSTGSDDKDKQIKDLQDKIKDLQDQVKKLEDSSSSAGKDLDKLKSQLKDAEDAKAELEQKLQEIDDQKYDEQIAEKQQTIDDLTKQLISLMPDEVSDSDVENGIVKNYHIVQGTGTAEDPKFVILADTQEVSTGLLSKLNLKEGKNYLIFVTTQDNKVEGDILTKYGMVCTNTIDEQNNSKYQYSFFDASAFTYKKDNGNGGGGGGIVMPGGGGGMDNKLTAAEIAELKSKIKETDLAVRVAENELKQMQEEKDNGQVVASVNGKIASVTDADTARADGTPMIKVTGTGGYKITCSIGELARDDVQIGEEVQVTSYENGGQYSGTIQSIGDMPTTENADYWSVSTNTSFYPMTVVVDADADLSDNEYVSVQRESAGTSSGEGFYLENMYILNENGKSYVYVRGDNNRLEKRQIKTGVIYYGSTQVLSGLDRNTDWIAFPYGKQVKDGAATREATTDELYNY